MAAQIGNIQGPEGPPGPTAVSADADNTAVLGSDELIYVPPGGGELISADEMNSARLGSDNLVYVPLMSWIPIARGAGTDPTSVSIPIPLDDDGRHNFENLRLTVYGGFDEGHATSLVMRVNEIQEPIYDSVMVYRDMVDSAPVMRTGWGISYWRIGRWNPGSGLRESEAVVNFFQTNQITNGPFYSAVATKISSIESERDEHTGRSESWGKINDIQPRQIESIQLEPFQGEGQFATLRWYLEGQYAWPDVGGTNADVPEQPDTGEVQPIDNVTD